jgi:regulator of protease activity HflC (stomatin/prohibitin superfamily)
LESALAWIGQLAEWVSRFIPRWFVLDVRVGGVKYVRGSRVVKLGPGIHWYWPLVTTYDTYPTVRQTDNLASQTIETRDGYTITVGGMLVYEVIDVERLLTTVHHAMRAVQDIALTAIHDVCANMAWAELCDEHRRGTLDTKLRNAAQKQLAEYGVRVLKCMLTDLAKTRVYRLIQSNQQDNS